MILLFSFCSLWITENTTRTSLFLLANCNQVESMEYRSGLVLLTLFLNVACSNRQPTEIKSVQHESKKPAKPFIFEETPIRQKLLNQFQQWKGVPYRYGGMNQNGVDCSGFVFLTFHHQLGKSLPRTTLLQSNVGVPVDNRPFKTGDLLFFKTGEKLGHVGIYLGESNFIHASTSRGVTISNINNSYWRRHFWKARRIESL